MPYWNLLFRRIHLYLGMLLLPWMLIYALSTFHFNHRGGSAHGVEARQEWSMLWEKDYTLELPAGQGGLREVAGRVLAEHGLTGPFGVQRQGQRLQINAQSFRHTQRLTYLADQKKLRAETRATPASEMLARLHFRTGYGQPGLLSKLWAFMVDLFCLTTLIWIGTGLYLWWKLTLTRTWGWVALGGGMVTIGLLFVTL